MHGQYDWIMSRNDHEGIVALVNRDLANGAQFVELPSTGHAFARHAYTHAAFGFNTLPFDHGNAKLSGNWIQNHERPGSAAGATTLDQVAGHRHLTISTRCSATVKPAES